MAAVDGFFHAFNRGDVEEVRRLAAPSYSYVEPLFPEPRDVEQHIALMREIVARYPDRRLQVRRRLPGVGAATVEAVWSGTAATDGTRLTLDMVSAGSALAAQ